MQNQKPLFPIPWWSASCRPCEKPDEIEIGDEFIIRFAGTDCDGNALFCVKRRPSCHDRRPPKPCVQPRYC